MRTVIAVAFVALLTLAAAIHPSAAGQAAPETGEDAAAEQMDQPEDSTGTDAPAEESNSEADPDSASDEQGAGNNAPMQDVHRLRPGACPEGPPCRRED
jgi:hypothetical protein